MPFNDDPPPVMVPENDQFRAGASTTPSTGRPLMQSPMETEKIGIPCAKLVVPSRGSTYQTRIDPPGSPARLVPSSATILSSGNARRQTLDDERLRAAVVLGDEVDLVALDADGRARPPAFQQHPARVARDLGRDPARAVERIARAAGCRSEARHRQPSSLRIQVAALERASAYSAVAAIGAATSLRSTGTKPSFSPK